MYVAYPRFKFFLVRGYIPTLTLPTFLIHPCSWVYISPVLTHLSHSYLFVGIFLPCLYPPLSYILVRGYIPLLSLPSFLIHPNSWVQKNHPLGWLLYIIFFIFANSLILSKDSCDILCSISQESS